MAAQHMNALSTRLNQLSAEMELFNEQTFPNDEAEYLRNKELKSAIVALITDASLCHNHSITEQALQLLFDHSGCHEDYEILQQLLPILNQQAGIPTQTLQQYLSSTPLSRWL